MPLSPPVVITCTIANAASLSDAQFVGPGSLLGIALPVFTSAALTFQGSHDGVTFFDLYDAAGVEVSVPASVGSRFHLAPTACGAVSWIKVRSGTSAAPVVQGAQRLISIVVQ